MNQVVPVSIDRPSVLSRVLFWVGLLVIPTILIIQVLVYQPFFNHFNDGSLLRLLEGNSWFSSVTQLVTYGGSGYGYPGARASGWTLIYPQYELSNRFGSTPLFILNILMFLLIVSAFGLAFSRLICINPRMIVPLALSTVLWPYTYDLVFFPSLEEKSVILGAAITTAGLSYVNASSPAPFYFLTVIGLTVGTNSKTQYAFFLVGLALAAIIIYKGNVTSKAVKTRIFAYLTLTLLSITVMIYQALFGSYNAGTRQRFSVDFFNSAPVQLMCLVVFGYCSYLLLCLYLQKFKLLALIPLAWMISFIAGIALWGYRTYFLTIFGVMMGSAVAVVVGNMKSIRLQQLATGGLILMAVGWTLFRIPQVFEPLHGIGAFTQGQIARELAEEGAVIYTSCVEGSGHFNYYTERKWGITPEFAPLTGEAAGYRFGIPDEGQYVFGDRRLCAAPGEVAEWDVVWASPGDDGFRLYKRPTS